MKTPRLLLGTSVLCLLGALPSLAGAGWLERSTGLRTPESIRKIAPNGVQFPHQRHSPPSYIAPDSVLNSRPANPTPKLQKPNPDWAQMQRIHQERNRQAQIQRQQQLQMQQNQLQMQQNQLQYQKNAMKAQQTGMILDAVIGGINALNNPPPRYQSQYPY